MIEPADLVKAFERNTRIIEMQTDGLSHEDSLIQTEYNINCLNWVVGHIVQYRDEMLDFLGHERMMSPEVSERYARESHPIVEDGPDVVQLDELVELARRSQDRIADVLGSMSREEFAEERTTGQRKLTVGSNVFFNYFHDTYHVGQTELLRQVAGVDDAII
jgi:uncharacterized damage-inducible protein DinB